MSEALNGFETIEEFYEERGGSRAIEHDFGYEWREGPATFRVSYNPETQDVYAVRVGDAAHPSFIGDVELLATGIVDVDVVRRALWWDETDDPDSLAIRREHAEEATTLAWARKRLEIGVGGTTPAPPKQESPGPAWLG